MAGTLTVTGQATGLISGTKTIGPLTMTGTSNLGEIEDAALATGDNAFTVPAGAYAVAIFMPNPTSATVKLRTNLNSTDGGVQIAPYTGSGATVLPLPAGTAVLTLNASTSVAAVELSFI